MYYTLPRDEWEEMSSEAKRRARKEGIYPEPPTRLPEDYREQLRQENEGGPG